MTQLGEATLTTDERRLLERWLDLLRERLGDRLVGVWLYGSRARGEPAHEESDVDLMVLTAEGSKAEEEEVRDAVYEAADSVGGDPWPFSVQVRSKGWPKERRAIEAFYIQEIDRDRVVLHGDPGEGGRERAPLRLSPGEMHPRTVELWALALRHFYAARAMAGIDPGSSIHSSYYAMLHAARAALSEQDRFVRTHRGTWHLFRMIYVDAGRFDAQLATQASKTQPVREVADYGDGTATDEEGLRALDVAERFLPAVAELIGAEPPRPPQR